MMVEEMIILDQVVGLMIGVDVMVVVEVVEVVLVVAAIYHQVAQKIGKKLNRNKKLQVLHQMK